MGFQPEMPLLESKAHAACRAVVILPARNEQEALPACLDSLAAQVDAAGNALAHDSFEVLLLLNNCTDASAEVAHRWKAANSGFRLHVMERSLPAPEAHVGTARRMLMDTAWHRLDQGLDQGRGQRSAVAILSTDSDTLAAPDWIARNLGALEDGADAVGGAIRLKAGELEALPAGARRAYLRDRRYQRLVAELEHWLDPQAGDPWPRHLEHFGASLACTPEIYALAGGMPAVKPLEDVAFVNALRRIGARLRHEPSVVVYTSSRMDGRAEVGLSGQLKIWQEMSERGEEHRVLSAAWLAHRFRMLRGLRALCLSDGVLRLEEYPESWRERILEVHGRQRVVPEFLGEIDCDRLIEETFRGEREGAVVRVNRNLAALLERCRAASAN